MLAYPRPHFRDLLVLAVAFATGIAIWRGDPRWELGEDLLLCGSFPLWLLLSGPWTFRRRYGWWFFVCLAGFAGLALLADRSGPMLWKVLAWNVLLWLYLVHEIGQATRQRAQRLFLLPLLAFPWITVDIQPWLFSLRLFNARAMEWLYLLLGVVVTRDETTVRTPVCSFTVVDECAGVHTFQYMALAGTLLTYFQSQTERRFWWLLPKVVVLAVLTNTARILMIALVGLGWGTQYTEGAAHTLLGWAVILVALAVTFRRPKRLPSARPVAPWAPF